MADYGAGGGDLGQINEEMKMHGIESFLNCKKERRGRTSATRTLLRYAQIVCSSLVL